MSDDEWIHRFTPFWSLARIREMLEKKQAEWQEDPEPGLVLRSEVRARLLEQQREVANGDCGRPLENFIPTDKPRSSEYTIRILKNADRQLSNLDPERGWTMLEAIRGLRKSSLTVSNL